MWAIVEAIFSGLKWRMGETLHSLKHSYREIDAPAKNHTLERHNLPQRGIIMKKTLHKAEPTIIFK